MKVLVVGSGAREDALSWRLAQSATCTSVVACPGNAGTAMRGENWGDLAVTDGKSIAQRARDRGVDLAVIGPETAIAAGVADRLRASGVATFGPDRSAGRLESSKVFAKRFMERSGVPTAEARVVRSLDAARKALSAWKGGCVVKADGLAGGKGVVVTGGPDEALAVAGSWFGSAGIPGGGTDVLLEERLSGRELSVFAFGDGRSFEVFASACDYKRAGDGDTGPNTGGMGAYSPPAGFPAGFEAIVEEQILQPVLRGLERDGESYVGVLYCGLMWTADGPKVIEFNVRFGDPETQAIVPRVQGDFADALFGCAVGARPRTVPSLSERACVAVVLATQDYPRTSKPVQGLPCDLGLGPDCVAFWGGSVLRGHAVDASGGRVLTLSALGDRVAGARETAYAAIGALAEQLGPNSGLTFRNDIARLSSADGLETLPAGGG